MRACHIRDARSWTNGSLIFFGTLRYVSFACPCRCLIQKAGTKRCSRSPSCGAVLLGQGQQWVHLTPGCEGKVVKRPQRGPMPYLYHHVVSEVPWMHPYRRVVVSGGGGDWTLKASREPTGKKCCYLELFTSNSHFCPSLLESVPQ